MDTLPFYHAQRLGFRINPFSRLELEEWRAIAVLAEAVTVTLQHDWSSMQIMGEKGRGKTTALLKLATIFAEHGQHAHYEYIAPGQHSFYTDIADPWLDVALIDEAQRLWPWEKHRLIAGVRAQTASFKLILGTHADFSRRFQRASLALTTVVLDTLEPSALQHILTHRLAYFVLDPLLPAPVTFTLPACNVLLRLFGSDLRSMEPFLYDIFAHLDKPIAITAEIIEYVAQDVNLSLHAGRSSNG